MRDRNALAVDYIDQALSRPGADAHPRLSVHTLCIKAWALGSLGRKTEQPEIMAEADSIARALADPLILAQVAETRSSIESRDDRVDVADALADEALHWARAAKDDWAIATAAAVSATAARSASGLRDRADRAASLLHEVGNIYQLGLTLASAAYAGLCRGSDRDASAFVSRAIPVTRDLDIPYLSMLLRGNAALAALFTGDTDAACIAFREELRLCRELVVLPFAFEGLSGLAAVAAVGDHLDRAARLYGAATAHRYDQVEDPVHARLRSTYFEPARSRRGAGTWDAAVRDGAHSASKTRSPTRSKNLVVRTMPLPGADCSGGSGALRPFARSPPPLARSSTLATVKSRTVDRRRRSSAPAGPLRRWRPWFNMAGEWVGWGCRRSCSWRPVAAAGTA